MQRQTANCISAGREESRPWPSFWFLSRRKGRNPKVSIAAGCRPWPAAKRAPGGVPRRAYFLKISDLMQWQFGDFKKIFRKKEKKRAKEKQIGGSQERYWEKISSCRHSVPSAEPLRLCAKKRIAVGKKAKDARKQTEFKRGKC